MDAWLAVLLGIVQGLAEWFPVSSSGHFVVLQHFLASGGLPLSFDLGLHLSTVLVLLIFFRKEVRVLTRSVLDIARDVVRGVKVGVAIRSTGHRRFACLVILAMIPTGIIGLLVDRFITERYMASLLPVGVAFLVQGSLVLSTKWGKGTRGTDGLTTKDAAVMGTMQGLSALSGLSRSGSTISSGVALGLDRTAAARFSFLAGIPALIAAAGLHITEFTGSGENFQPEMLLIGCVAAFVVGLASLKGLLMILRGTKFYMFAIYSFVFGAAVLSLYFLGY